LRITKALPKSEEAVGEEGDGESASVVRCECVVRRLFLLPNANETILVRGEVEKIAQGADEVSERVKGREAETQED